jgi:adenylate cyclase
MAMFLNTAARIQKQCKRYKKKILATSEFAMELMENTNEYQIEYVDLIKFFGKKNSIKIYEVHPAEN